FVWSFIIFLVSISVFSIKEPLFTTLPIGHFLRNKPGTAFFNFHNHCVLRYLIWTNQIRAMKMKIFHTSLRWHYPNQVIGYNLSLNRHPVYFEHKDKNKKSIISNINIIT